MKLQAETTIKQILEIKDNETNQTYFLIENNGKWDKISKEEYKKIIEE